MGRGVKDLEVGYRLEREEEGPPSSFTKTIKAAPTYSLLQLVYTKTISIHITSRYLFQLVYTKIMRILH